MHKSKGQVSRLDAGNRFNKRTYKQTGKWARVGHHFISFQRERRKKGEKAAKERIIKGAIQGRRRVSC